MHDNKNTYDHDALHKSPPGTERTVVRIKFNGACFADFLEKREPAITGLTAFLLVMVTFGLFILGLRQEATARIFQRAYIAVEPGGTREFEGADDRIACDIFIVNAGNLPASRVRWAIYKGYSRKAALKKFPIRNKDLIEHGIVLAPKARAQKGTRPTRKKRFDTFRIYAEPDKAWLYVWGRISYHDGFRGRRRIDFCHRYNLRGASGYAIPKENGRHHEHGNRTDED
jgi:hypothetical protein